MNTIKLIEYVVAKACLTQKEVGGVFGGFVSDLKKVFDQYLEGCVEVVEKRNERRFEESIAWYQAMQEEAEQELEKLRRPND